MVWQRWIRLGIAFGAQWREPEPVGWFPPYPFAAPFHGDSFAAVVIDDLGPVAALVAQVLDHAVAAVRAIHCYERHHRTPVRGRRSAFTWLPPTVAGPPRVGGPPPASRSPG